MQGRSLVPHPNQWHVGGVQGIILWLSWRKVVFIIWREANKLLTSTSSICFQFGEKSSIDFKLKSSICVKIWSDNFIPTMVVSNMKLLLILIVIWMRFSAKLYWDLGSSEQFENKIIWMFCIITMVKLSGYKLSIVYF